MNDYLEQERLEETRHIISVITYKMAVPLFFSFWLLDLLYVPQYKWEFLSLCCLILPTAIVTGWWLTRVRNYRQAQAVGLFLVFMCGAILHVMTIIMGKDSLYIVALQLVAIGGLSFIPWSRGNFVAALILIYAPYYAIELVRSAGSTDKQQLLINSFFSAGVISITWVIHAYREQLRRRELTMRIDLEKEVAQRKQTEQDLIVARDQALAATQAKESFLANMSHEIRTPLTAIIGFAEHALDQEMSRADRMTALNTIVASGHHLLNIINDILDFSKIEANSIELETIAMNPIQLAEEVQSLVMSLISKKELQIKLEYHFPLPVSIASDPVRIKQILINLCSNAIKFTEHGVISIALAFDEKGKQMIYRVTDAGIGMTAEQMEHVFDPFKQADSSITRRYGGTGLGLSLSRRLARLLGGDLSVNSRKNVGSEFELRINAGDNCETSLIHSLDQISRRVHHEPEIPAAARLDGKVLLAEDNENNQRLFSLYLNKLGLQVTLAENGAIAVTLALNNHFDVVLMDMQMPVLSGVDAVRQLRAGGYAQPVIALTANATNEDRRLCLEAGCQDFLTKPVTRDRLYQMLAKYVRKELTACGEVEPLFSTLSEQEPEFDEIVKQYVAKLPDQIAALDAAFYANDWQKFREIAHNLKGMGGGFGYPQLTEDAAEIEKMLQQQNYAAIVPIISDLKLTLQRIQAGQPPATSRDERSVG